MNFTTSVKFGTVKLAVFLSVPCKEYPPKRTHTHTHIISLNLQRLLERLCWSGDYGHRLGFLKMRSFGRSTYSNVYHYVIRPLNMTKPMFLHDVSFGLVFSCHAITENLAEVRTFGLRTCLPYGCITDMCFPILSHYRAYVFFPGGFFLRVLLPCRLPRAAGSAGIVFEGVDLFMGRK